MSGLVLVPTLNRPKLVERFVKSYEDTGSTVPVWFLIDDSELLQSFSGDISIKKTGTAVTMGDKCRFIWPQVIEAKPEWVGLLNDDHILRTHEWDKKVEALIDGTNMVSSNDGHWNFGVNVVGITAWSMPVLQSAGFPIFPRNLQHYFIDNLWKSIGEATGCWVETMKINIEHAHVFNGKMEADDTFRKVNDPKRTSYDQKEAEYFMQHDLGDVVARIKALRINKEIDKKFV